MILLGMYYGENGTGGPRWWKMDVDVLIGASPNVQPNIVVES